MNTNVVEAPHAAVPDLAGLEPVEKIKRRWPMILGGALTLLMILSLGRELFGSGLSGLARSLPTNPLFYVAFLVYYFGPPTFDYLIFRRLWRIPIDGMAALHKKRIANEVLLGYSGEAYFYAWARQRTQMVAAPFGAVKDVMILSAIAGNAVTLAVMAIALPLCIELLTPTYQTYAYGSVALLILMSLPFLIFSKRVFSLPTPDLAWVFGIHCARIVIGSVVIAFAWHLAMPSVPIGFWLLMSAGRLLVWRLPLIPSKELAFSAIAGVLIGQGTALSELMALVAGLVLLCHVTLIGGFSIQSLVAKIRA
ncbi:MAG: hypothetical protein EOP62_20950 [Sphingomonadales bacterium]|nr:MAG: hypothetical protein EOP62_20950 [Sphingomonadales bacterium]